MMIVAHGSWMPDEGRFFLWGESDAHAAGQESSGEELIHPFHLAPSDVRRKILERLTSEKLEIEVPSISRLFSLPSVSGSPLPSPELLYKKSFTGQKAQLSTWRVFGLSLQSQLTLRWLVALPMEDQRNGGSLRIGSDLCFWAMAARFALEILARQRFLPGVVDDEGSARSRWEPLFEEEHERMESMQVAMPSACRAITGLPRSSQTMLESFMTELVDGFVRQAALRLRLRPRFQETSGERLVASLLDESGELEQLFSGIESLSKELKIWKDRLNEERESPFRIAFRLEPPNRGESEARDEDAGETKWLLRYFLQAVDDESLLVPLARIWEHSGITWQYLSRRMDRPQERVLQDLANASTLFAPIEESLKTARPETCELELSEAYQFLDEAAILLKESDFGVLVPSWWRKRNTSLGLTVRFSPSSSRSLTSSRVGLDTILEYDWQVALGGQRLSRKEFLQLAEMKLPLVRVRGQWVELNPEQVAELLPVVRDQNLHSEMNLRDALQLAFGRGGPEVPRPVTGFNAEGWIEELLARLAGSEPMPEISPPDEFQGTLRPYQVAGLTWLDFLRRWELGACLADDMGLGKTIQILALLLHMQSTKELDKPFLLICPTSVLSNWRKEAARFAPSLRVLIHHGLDRHEGERFVEETEKHHLVVSTYSLVHRDLEQFRSVQWKGLFLDEAQNIKNPQAKQTRALRRLEAPVRVALTGTPVENRLSELWSIMEFLNPGYLGSESTFRNKYAVPIERYRDPAVTEELQKLVRPFVLRRLKTDPAVIRDLPEKNEMKVYCGLTREQATLYAAVVQESLSRIESAEGIGRKGAVLAALTRLKQVCNHPAHYLNDKSSLSGRSGKLSRLTEMLEEVIAESDAALVFTQFAQMGKLLQHHLGQQLAVEVLLLHGGVPSLEREQMIARFQEEGRAPIFVLSLKAGGFGLNLTRAHHVFHFDRWWNPAVEDQATDRAFRIGQTQAVAVHKFICAGTIEETVDEMIERKKDLANTVIQSGESWLTELSTEELKDLFSLRTEVFEDE